MGWIIKPVIDHTINISKHQSLNDCSYNELPKALDCTKLLLILKILMIINALEGVWSDSCILPIIIQEELQTLKKEFAKRHKDIKFPI